jgi:hypothetical protein
LEINSKRIAVSLPVSAEVGSSMTSSSTLKEMAFAISTICFCAIFRSRTLRRGSIFSPSFDSIPAASSCIRLKLMRPAAPRGSLQRKMFCATDSSLRRFSSWWIMDTPTRCISRGVAPRRMAPPLNTTSPPSSVCTPERIFISVDLPAPFSPQRPMISPLSTLKSTLCRTSTPKKLFEIPFMWSIGAPFTGRPPPRPSRA